MTTSLPNSGELQEADLRFYARQEGLSYEEVLRRSDGTMVSPEKWWDASTGSIPEPTFSMHTVPQMVTNAPRELILR